MKWISKRAVLFMHQSLIADSGGSALLRDEALLESALSRPQNLFAYENADVISLAASLCFGLIKNHPFVDGNKRVAFMAMYTFLKINGLNFSASEEDVVVQVTNLAAGEITEAEFEKWVRGECF